VGPEITLLGCGVPLGPSIGIFDAMRIGADVDPSWEPHLFPPQIIFRLEPNMPSTRNALQNILTRAFTHKRWWLNDPDCLMIRPESDLSLAEVQTLATAIAITGGSLLLSDELTNLPDKRTRIAQQLVPLVDKPARVLDWFDSPTPRLLRLDLENKTGKWHIFGVFNWTNKMQDCSLTLAQLDLPGVAYFTREFWNGSLQRVSDGTLRLSGIPPHGATVIALTPMRSGNDSTEREKPLYLGSDLHISQGLEVAEWSLSQQGDLHIALERPGLAEGVIDLYLPEPPQSASLNGMGLSWQQVGEQIYRFSVVFDRQAVIELKGISGIYRG
jgi:alpha-galactosidase